MKDEMLKMLRGNISDRVVEAMGETPRELFVPDGIRHMAYEDHPLPIGESQTISAPHMVAIMCDVLDLREGMMVLDVGTGSGYHAAVMADLVGPEGHVYSIERIPELVVYAKRNLREAGIENVLKVGGKLVIPVGTCYQELVLVIRTDEGFELEHHGGVVFVPLIGDHGFKI
jgi:protein-L-isoaspartate(D-aspartate) O-methyltransferase